MEFLSGTFLSRRGSEIWQLVCCITGRSSADGRKDAELFARRENTTASATGRWQRPFTLTRDAFTQMHVQLETQIHGLNILDIFSSKAYRSLWTNIIRTRNAGRLNGMSRKFYPQNIRPVTTYMLCQFWFRDSRKTSCIPHVYFR